MIIGYNGHTSLRDVEFEDTILESSQRLQNYNVRTVVGDIRRIQTVYQTISVREQRENEFISFGTRPSVVSVKQTCGEFSSQREVLAVRYS